MNFEELVECESSIPTLSYGCEILDLLLGQSLFMKGIVEIYGESGSGKTQLCLQIAAEYAKNQILKQTNKKVLYISTAIFPINRLRQLVINHGGDSQNVLDNICILKILTFDDFINLYNKEKHKIKRLFGLLIIDSVAPLFWGSNEANGMGNRTRSISQLSYILHKINTIKKIDGIIRNGIGILCTNEVRSESSLLR
ncbi:DNA repair and recombination protein RadA [Thelohanellus kitauei]|uniref:DNA repair and recombination protein RadA n=1 Tax=Thelohanellus kitauei TaxID=669202 RepID=A0A0C2JSV5_THEKT|nr:DNA repair and recombination protein RadA [Thelohanellus kitauei]